MTGFKELLARYFYQKVLYMKCNFVKFYRNNRLINLNVIEYSWLYSDIFCIFLAESLDYNRLQKLVNLSYISVTVFDTFKIIDYRTMVS